MERWYAVHTKARQEQLASEHLERQGFNVYLPLMRAARRRRGRWKSLVEPMFPGYLFVKIDIHDQDVSPIRSTCGVIRMVRFGEQLQPVPESIVKALSDCQPDRESPIDPSALFRPGDEVTIVEGPFTGLRAIFEAKTGEERVCILLDILGRTNRIAVDTHHIVPT